MAMKYTQKRVQRKREILERFGIECDSNSKKWKNLTEAVLDQVEACMDDEARRLILGVSSD